MTRKPSIVPLCAIHGRSPLNVRANGADDDIEGLAASIAALGLLQPLIVSCSIADDDGTMHFWTIDGGRRHAALQLLAARGTLDADAPIQVLVDDSDVDGEIVEASLAANVVRRNLHPADEYAAFADLAARKSVAEIAAHFGVTERYVKQRLSIEKMAPRIRDMWRAGEIATEIAQAFSYGDHEQQKRLLSDIFDDGATRAWMRARADAIIGDLTQATLTSEDPEAIYVGINDYVAAGGVTNEDLFRDKIIFCDGALVKRLARERMMREGEDLLDKFGYGALVNADDVEDLYNWSRLPPQFTPAELERKAQIEAKREQIIDEGQRESADDVDARDRSIKRIAAIEEEEEEIEAAAMERAGSAEQRAAAYVVARLNRHGDERGRVTFELGCLPPKDAKFSDGATKIYRSGTTPDDMTAARAAPASNSKGASAKASAEDKAPGKALAHCLDTARTRAFVALVSARPMLAMVLAYAALTARSNTSPVRIATQRRNDLVGALPQVPFAGTAAMLIAEMTAAGDADAGLKILFDRFAGAIAAAIVCEPTEHGMFQPGCGPAAPSEIEAVALLIRQASGDVFAQTMAHALDYKAYFAAVPRARILALYDGFASNRDLDVKKLGKADLVEAVARVAKDRAWLPAELQPPAPAAKPKGRGKGKAAAPDVSLADAMLQALDADEPAPASTPAQAIDEAPPAESSVAVAPAAPKTKASKPTKAAPAKTKPMPAKPKPVKAKAKPAAKPARRQRAA